jgi:hypothetical protein
MNQEPKKTQDCEDQDEITLAKDIFDEIVEETESEDWGKKNKEEPHPSSLFSATGSDSL